jgi:hypothetical protein
VTDPMDSSVPNTLSIQGIRSVTTRLNHLIYERFNARPQLLNLPRI